MSWDTEHVAQENLGVWLRTLLHLIVEALGLCMRRQCSGFGTRVLVNFIVDVLGLLWQGL